MALLDWLWLWCILAVLCVCTRVKASSSSEYPWSETGRVPPLRAIILSDRYTGGGSLGAKFHGILSRVLSESVGGS